MCYQCIILNIAIRQKENKRGENRKEEEGKEGMREEKRGEERREEKEKPYFILLLLSAISIKLRLLGSPL